MSFAASAPASAGSTATRCCSSPTARRGSWSSCRSSPSRRGISLRRRWSLRLPRASLLPVAIGRRVPDAAHAPGDGKAVPRRRGGRVRLAGGGDRGRRSGARERWPAARDARRRRERRQGGRARLRGHDARPDPRLRLPGARDLAAAQPDAAPRRLGARALPARRASRRGRSRRLRRADRGHRLPGRAGGDAAVYGSEYDVGRLELALLGVGVGCYLATSTFSQALLALDRGRIAAAGWIVSSVIFLGVYFVAPGESADAGRRRVRRRHGRCGAAARAARCCGDGRPA